MDINRFYKQTHRMWFIMVVYGSEGINE